MPRESVNRSLIKHRSEAKKAVRLFFEKRGFDEVDPCGLRSSYCLDPFIEIFTSSTSSGKDLFLQSSPELAMKHLLCESTGPIYYLGPAWRRSEEGPFHSREFTMLEWYRKNPQKPWEQSAEELPLPLSAEIKQLSGPKEASYLQLMQETVDLCYEVLSRENSLEKNCRVFALGELIQRTCSLDVHTSSLEELFHSFQKKLDNMGLCHGLSKTAPSEPFLLAKELNWAFGMIMHDCIEPWIAKNYPNQIVVIHDFISFYPAKADCALAKAHTLPSGIHIAQRFELYFNALELANGYNELTDGDEMQRRQEEAGMVKGLSEEEVENQIDWKLIDLMKKNRFPNSCGVAVGFDRLLMLNHREKSLHRIEAIRVDR